MSRRLTLGLAACLLLPLGIGCSTNPGIVRGQSPSPDHFPTATPVYGAEQPVHTQPVGYPLTAGPGMPSGPMPNGFAGDMCPPGVGWGGPHAGDGCFGYGFRPKHHYTYNYQGQKKGHLDYTYPAPNQPPAYVQYPYYTHKGPSDFFLQ